MDDSPSTPAAAHIRPAAAAAGHHQDVNNPFAGHDQVGRLPVVREGVDAIIAGIRHDASLGGHSRPGFERLGWIGKSLAVFVAGKVAIVVARSRQEPADVRRQRPRLLRHRTEQVRMPPVSRHGLSIIGPPIYAHGCERRIAGRNQIANERRRGEGDASCGMSRDVGQSGHGILDDHDAGSAISAIARIVVGRPASPAARVRACGPSWNIGLPRPPICALTAMKGASPSRTVCCSAGATATATHAAISRATAVAGSAAAAAPVQIGPANRVQDARAAMGAIGFTAVSNHASPAATARIPLPGTIASIMTLGIGADTEIPPVLPRGTASGPTRLARKPVVGMITAAATSAIGNHG